MKHNDPLEKFILDHRPEFESFRAPEKTWGEIEKNLSTTRSVWLNYRTALRIAAGFVLLAAAYFFFDSQKNDRPQPLIDYAVQSDYSEAEEYFVSAVNEKRSQLKKIHDDATIDSDLSLLDQMEGELRKEYNEAQGPYKEVVLNALIDNYQTKLSLLQLILSEVEEKEAAKSIYHEM